MASKQFANEGSQSNPIADCSLALVFINYATKVAISASTLMAPAADGLAHFLSEELDL
jgi:hypothetical protein